MENNSLFSSLMICLHLFQIFLVSKKILLQKTQNKIFLILFIIMVCITYISFYLNEFYLNDEILYIPRPLFLINFPSMQPCLKGQPKADNIHI